VLLVFSPGVALTGAQQHSAAHDEAGQRQVSLKSAARLR
jgi:hypothetical protein